jgi:hypothetical protein
MCKSVDIRICVWYFSYFKPVNENSHLKNNLKLVYTHTIQRSNISRSGDRNYIATIWNEIWTPILSIRPNKKCRNSYWFLGPHNFKRIMMTMLTTFIIKLLPLSIYTHINHTWIILPHVTKLLVSSRKQIISANSIKDIVQNFILDCKLFSDSWFTL